MRFRFPLLASLACLMVPVVAEAGPGFVQSPAYKDCTGLAATNPSLALTKAEAWLKIDNGIAANHCRAMALYGLHRYPEAAVALGAVHDGIAHEDITLRTYVARQEARAWLNASRPDAAITVLGKQVDDMTTIKGNNATVAQLTADLLLDRAKLRETYGQLPDAIQDLDHAVSLAPMNEEVLIERARVFRQLGDTALAKQDLQAVLRSNPTKQEAVDMMRDLRDTPTQQAAPAVAPPVAAPAP